MKSKAPFAAALLGLCFTPSSPAAQAPHSPEELEKAATHIVVGRVTKVDVKLVLAPRGHGLGFRDRRYALQIKIESAPKGADIAAGDTITVHAWRPARSLRPRPPGPQGHYPLPAEGDKVKVFLKKQDDQYQVIHPNGFEPLDAAPRKGG